jgi:hypothetical protein
MDWTSILIQRKFLNNTVFGPDIHVDIKKIDMPQTGQEEKFLFVIPSLNMSLNKIFKKRLNCPHLNM